MQKLTIEKISRKDGEGANGSWHKVGIISKELGDKWLGCFASKYNRAKLDALTEGQTIEVVTEVSGDFLNFRFPTQIDVLTARVEKLEAMFANKDVESPKDIPGHDSPDVDPDDIPF